MTQPTLTENGHIQLDKTITLWKNPIETTGVTLGFDLGMNYCSVDNTYCQIRTKSHGMSFNITPEQLEEMARLMREEIKRINEGKYLQKVVAQ